jgi:hypothetical protein
MVASVDLYRFTLKVHVLKSVHRQRTDPAFIKILNELRVGFVSEETAALLKGRELPLLSETGIVPTRLYPLYLLCFAFPAHPTQINFYKQSRRQRRK